MRLILGRDLGDPQDEAQRFVDGIIGRKRLSHIRGQQHHILARPAFRRITPFGDDAHLREIVLVSQFVIVTVYSASA